MRPMNVLCGVILGLTVPASTVAAADCTTALADLNAAVGSAEAPDIGNAIAGFKQAAACNAPTRAVALRKSAALLAQRAQGHLTQDQIGAALSLLDQAPALHWLVQVTRADIAAKQDRRADAASLYNAALDTIMDVALTPEQDQLAGVAKRVAQLAQENTMLAGTLEGSVKRGGDASGVYKALARGIVFEPDSSATSSAKSQTSQQAEYAAKVVQKVFLPIRFGFDTDHLDAAGEVEAKRLVDYITAQNITRLLLVGHTDEIGSEPYNLDLSQRRAAKLSVFLKSSGVTAHIETQGRGESAPPNLSDATLYDDEQRRAIARRVELVLRY